MARTTTRRRGTTGRSGDLRAGDGRSAELKGAAGDALSLRNGAGATGDAEPLVHIIRPGVRCDTENRGQETPQGRSLLEIVVDASEGFIPLWAEGTTLRWRFRESSMRIFKNPIAAKAAITQLFGEAVVAWGGAVPVRFAQRSDAWDFEIVMRRSDDCDDTGCVLASAFFPDAGRHKLTLYPKLFELTRIEMVETLAHEIGHIFGLRHFFALVDESEWPAQIFGKHDKFSIMNYGDESHLTAADRDDLKALYLAAWAGTLTQINGTPIKLVRPFHEIGAPAPALAAAAAVRPLGV